MMLKLIYIFYAVVAVITLSFLVEAWIDSPDAKLPYRGQIQRRW